MKSDLLTRHATMARAAVAAYLEGRPDDFFIHAATSIELGQKAFLAGIHPVLIVGNDLDSLLHACQAPQHSRVPPWRIRTITAKEARARCSHIEPRFRELDRLALLAELRNSALHLGSTGSSVDQEILRDFIRGTELLAELNGVELADIFKDFCDFAITTLTAATEAIEQTVREEIERAKHVFRQRYGTLTSDEQRQALLDATRQHTARQEQQEYMAQCPACGEDGILSGEWDVTWEVDIDREGRQEGPAYPVVTLIPEGFYCFFCDLGLKGLAELKVANLGEAVPIENVDPTDLVDPDDYYFDA